MNIDKIFKTETMRSTDFQFDTNVAEVFDDMVIRSVPYYLEFQRMIAELSSNYAQPDTSLYDLGCSAGTTFLTLNPVIDPSVKFVGIDNSEEMLEKCRGNLTNNAAERPFQLVSVDLNNTVEIQNASVVVLCLTLQFVRPLNRLRLLQSVYQQLNPGGCIIMIEKVLGETAVFNRKFITYYYDLKRRNNYDDMEIAGKREALENILIPYKLSENIQMLKESKFHSCEVFFKWYNFTGIVALK